MARSTFGVGIQNSTNLLSLYSWNVHVFVVYPMVFVTPERVLGGERYNVPYMYFLPLELLEKEVYVESVPVLSWCSYYKSFLG